MFEEEKKQQLLEWWNLPVKQRKPKTQAALCRKLGISESTAYKWRKEPPNNGAKEPNPQENYDSQQWLASRNPDADEALLRAVQKGNAQAIRVFYQLIGQLVEKSETKVKLELSADEIASQHIENRRWLREHGYLEEPRMGQV